MSPQWYFVLSLLMHHYVLFCSVLAVGFSV